MGSAWAITKYIDATKVWIFIVYIASTYDITKGIDATKVCIFIVIIIYSAD